MHPASWKKLFLFPWQSLKAKLAEHSTFEALTNGEGSSTGKEGHTILLSHTIYIVQYYSHVVLM